MYCARFALIFHLIGEDRASLSVGVDALERAIALSEWFAHEVKRVIIRSRLDAHHSKLMDAVEWIARKGGRTTPRELVREYRQVKRTDEAEELLSELVQCGLGRFQVGQPSERGGPPRRTFILTSCGQEQDAA